MVSKGARVNVIFADNGSGLSRDAVVLREALEKNGHRVWLSPRAPRRYPFTLNYVPELTRQTVRGARNLAARSLARRSRFTSSSKVSFPSTSNAPE